MKNIIVLLVLSVFGLFSCSSCKTSNLKVNNELDAMVLPIADSSALDSAVANNVMQVSTDDFDLSLENERQWKVTDIVDLPAKLVLVNDEERTSITIFIDNFVGSDKEYSLFILRGFKESGQIFEASESVKINGKDFYLLSTHKDNLFVFTWIFSNKKNSYVLSCAGKKDKLSQLEFCNKVINTLILKM